MRHNFCVFHTDRVVLRLDPTFIPKVNSTFHRTQELVLPNFCANPTHRLECKWHTFNVRRALRIYIKTAPFHCTEALFVSFQATSLGSKTSPSSIGRWIRACITKAYTTHSLVPPQRITTHSTRSADITAAWVTQASVEEICRATTWTSPSPFICHYRLDKYTSAEAAFDRKVLQQVHSVPGSSARTLTLP